MRKVNHPIVNVRLDNEVVIVTINIRANHDIQQYKQHYDAASPKSSKSQTVASNLLSSALKSQSASQSIKDQQSSIDNSAHNVLNSLLENRNCVLELQIHRLSFHQMNTRIDTIIQIRNS
jgi:hypothetical protein